MIRVKRLLSATLKIILPAAALAAYGFVNSDFDRAVIGSLEIEIENDRDVRFLSAEIIEKRLRHQGIALVGMTLEETNPTAIRSVLLEMDEVAEAGVYMRSSGTLSIRVKQRTPLCRILNPDGTGFYLDGEGRSMQLSGAYTPHVPVFVTHSAIQAASVRGRMNVDPSERTALDDCYRLAHFISEHSQLGNLCEHVVEIGPREFDIIPRIGDFHIRYGSANRLEQKTEKLFIFLEHAMGRAELRAFKRIDLRFKNQVVCTLR